MTSKKPRVKVRRLTGEEKRQLQQREADYGERLAQQGLKCQTVIDESGVFGVILVMDPKSDRKGLLMPDGTVRWIDRTMAPGSLAEAAVSGVEIEDLPQR